MEATLRPSQHVFSLLLAVTMLSALAKGAIAQSNNAAAMADGLSRMSFADLAPLQQDVVTDEFVVPAGTRMETILTPYDMGWENLTLDQIQQYSGVDIGSLPISSFPGLPEYLARQSQKPKTPSFMASLQPWLLIQPASAQVPPPKEAVQIIDSIPGIGGVSLKSITGPLGSGALKDLGVPEIPKLSDKLKIPTIDKIPGLEYLPLALSILTLKDYVIPMDVVYGGGKNFGSPCKMGRECKEDVVLNNTASGNADNTSIPCKKEDFEGEPDCGHLEVRRRGGMGAQRKIRWVNKLQKVPGAGANFLCTKEPTGRYPFGYNPKLVLESVDEHANTATFALYFYIEIKELELKSAACLGPIPLPVWGTRKAGQLIFFGPDKVSGDSPLAGVVSGVQNPGYGSSGGCGGVQSSAGPDTKYGYSKQPIASESDLTSVATPSYLNRTEQLNKNAAADFERMRQAAKSQGINLSVISGYRSVDEQTVLWDRQIARQGSEEAAALISAPPGYSEHHNGYALDLSDSSGSTDLSQSFQNTAAYQWLKANAATYGFSQSYDGTSGKGAGNEPWHWQHKDSGSSPSNQKSLSSGSPSSENCSSPTFSGSLKNGFVYPAKGPVTSNFGWRIHPVLGTRKFHDGMDIGAEQGSPIYAVNNGVVVSAGEAGGYGNFTCIDHGRGLESCYAHQSAINVSVGQQVKAGQTIGAVGSTGRSTGPHLHVEFRQNGNPVDPAQYLR
jgi:murein DD-endopeptidase MepM/ murein hydrolase activator NlpD